MEKYEKIFCEYEKFWERTNKDRPILNVTYLKEGATGFRAPESIEEKWLSEEYRYNAYKHNLNVIGYTAEGVPMTSSNIGPGCLAGCIGGEYQLADKTVWYDKLQLVEEWENPPEISFDPNCELWQHIERIQAYYSKDPEAFLSIVDIGGILDIVASLRGTENLLYDLYDYPDEVKEFSAKVKNEWFKAFDRQVEAVKKANMPFNSWMNIPSKKPWYPIQCDFCYMISPDQFREFVLPDVTDQVNYMDRSIYHLDGIGEIPHVDMLLDIPRLNGIQWVAGDGQAPLWDEKWFELYRKIQDKKKNLVLIGGVNERDMVGAERLIKSIDPTGVYIGIGCSSKEKAEEMVEKITRWCE